MAGSSTDTFKEFYCVEDGLTFTVRVYQLPDGSFEAKVTVFEGSADFNAVYFGDGVDDGSSTNLNGNLNMSGGGSVDHDGNAVDWDDAVVLSKPGLGPEGADKDTYLSEGESFTFPLDIASLDEIQDIGVRATSTSTPEGSIKCVLDPIEEDQDDEQPDDQPEAPVVEEEVVESGDEVPPAEDVPLEDLSDQAYFETIATLVGSVGENDPPEDADEPDGDMLALL